MQSAETIGTGAVQPPQAHGVVGGALGAHAADVTGKEAGLVGGQGRLRGLLCWQALALALGQRLVVVGGHGLGKASMTLCVARHVRCEAALVLLKNVIFSPIVLKTRNLMIKWNRHWTNRAGSLAAGIILRNERGHGDLWSYSICGTSRGLFAWLVLCSMQVL